MSSTKCDTSPCYSSGCPNDNYYTRIAGRSIPCDDSCDVIRNGRGEYVRPKCFIEDLHPPPPSGKCDVPFPCPRLCSVARGTGRVQPSPWEFGLAGPPPVVRSVDVQFRCNGWDYRNPRATNMSETDRTNCCSVGEREMERRGVCDCGWCGGAENCNRYMTNLCGTRKGWLSSAKEVCDSYATRHGSREMLRSLIDSELQCDRPAAGNCVYKPNAPINDVMLKYCRQNPGICDLPLSRMCASHTRKELENDETLRKLCGCFLPREQYPFRGRIREVCDPLCVNGAVQSSIGDPNRSDIRFDKCQDSVCIIDDVAINSVQSEGFNPTFNVMCRNCGSKRKCGCFFGNITANNYGEARQAGIKFDVDCGNCWVLHEGRTFPIDCKNLDGYFNYQGEREEALEELLEREKKALFSLEMKDVKDVNRNHTVKAPQTVKKSPKSSVDVKEPSVDVTLPHPQMKGKMWWIIGGLILLLMIMWYIYKRLKR